MRIALVTEYYYPHLGGVTEHVHNLARQLHAAGHEATIVTARMGDTSHDEPYVRRIGTSRVIYSNSSLARVTTGSGLRRKLRDLFRTERIDVVHLHGPLAPTFGLVADLAASDLGIPVVGTFHTWFPNSPLYRLFRRPLQRRFDRYAAAIAVSHPAVEAHSRYFDHRWEIIPNGIDTELFHPAGRRPFEAAPAEAPRILFLGRLDPRNGLETALRALPVVLRAYPEARLTVAGSGPLLGHYRRLAEPVREHVEFLGHVNGTRPAIYAGADLYVCPTTKASFGITLLEAMACATPQVVSDITGFRELVAGGQEAVLVPLSDPKAWARAAIDLLADPARRAAMGAAGRAKALAYSWPLVAARVLDVYRRVTR
ncbi:MAG TPA: glycosyltransferase family 4 protein [Gemmatimonadales bacterium]|nr:glycosyltransferase family 4 protein [Gemmatimonadales bacterium]